MYIGISISRESIIEFRYFCPLGINLSNVRGIHIIDRIIVTLSDCCWSFVWIKEIRFQYFFPKKREKKMNLNLKCCVFVCALLYMLLYCISVMKMGNRQYENVDCFTLCVSRENSSVIFQGNRRRTHGTGWRQADINSLLLFKNKKEVLR